MNQRTKDNLRKRKQEKEVSKGRYKGDRMDSLRRAPSTPRPSIGKAIWDRILGPKDELKIKK
jgi:hypothetical protein